MKLEKLCFKHRNFEEVKLLVNIHLIPCLSGICCEYSQQSVCHYSKKFGIFITKNINAVYDQKEQEWNLELSPRFATIYGFEETEAPYELNNFFKHREHIMYNKNLDMYGPYISHKLFTSSVIEKCHLLIKDSQENILNKLTNYFPDHFQEILTKMAFIYKQKKTNLYF